MKDKLICVWKVVEKFYEAPPEFIQEFIINFLIIGAIVLWIAGMASLGMLGKYVLLALLFTTGMAAIWTYVAML